MERESRRNEENEQFGAKRILFVRGFKRRRKTQQGRRRTERGNKEGKLTARDYRRTWIEVDERHKVRGEPVNKESRERVRLRRTKK